MNGIRPQRFAIMATIVVGFVTVSPSRAAEEPPLPMADPVDAQPLLAQVARLRQAMKTTGDPFPAEVETGLDRLTGETDAKTVTSAIQRVLDPLCLATVEIVEGKPPRVVANPGPHELVEQGWRKFLIKVVNRAGVTGRLRVESPNARPMPWSPANEVASRWLGIDGYDGHPIKADLGGLGLEYRIVQAFGRDPGRRSAVLEFHVGGPRDRASSVIRDWRFDKDTDGWKAVNQVKLDVGAGSLDIQSTGDDPSITASASSARGRLVLRFWAKAERGRFGRVLWWTTQRPQPDEAHAMGFTIEPGRERLYEVPIPNEGDLIGLQLHPGDRPDRVRIDWMELARADRGAEDWPSATVDFRTEPSTVVTFRVKDGDDDRAMASFVIRDARGRIYPPQAKRLAPDFFFQTQVYRSSGETVRLPAGEYTVRCARGPESIPKVVPLTVGREPITLTYDVERWIDTARLGWWSGDHHIHAAGCAHYENPTQGVTPEDMIRHTMGEDLKVGCSLTWGPCFDFQKQFFSGKVDDVSRYPYLLRYDVEVSGFGSDRSGHLNLIRLKDQIYPGGDSKDHWPTLGLNTLRWAKKQGAVCGPAHSANGLTRHVGRVPGTEGKDGPGGLPTYQIPAYDGIGANEFIVQIAHEVPGPDGKLVPAVDFISTMDTDRTAEWNMWYHVLNCGFRVRASGETDFPCLFGERVGIGRVYVQVPGKLDYERWVEGLQKGRSYVSDGTAHLLDFTLARSGEGNRLVPVGEEEIALDRPENLKAAATVAAFDGTARELKVELVVNGLPVASKSVMADGKPHPVTFDVAIAKSSWVAIRTFPSAHTNPIFVVVSGRPIRSSRLSAEWCLRGIDQCWSQKSRTYKAEETAEAKDAYEQARVVFRKILSESDAD